MFKGHPWWTWVLLVIIPVIAYSVSFATNSSSVFKDVDLPAFAPPRATFGIVWALLYITIGIVATRLVQSAVFRKSVSSPAFIILAILFIGTFVMNLAWTPVFAKDKKASLFLLLAMLAGSASMLPLMAKLDTASTSLFIPYITWLLFAMLLNKEMISSE